MSTSIERKLERLGLSQRGVLSTRQKMLVALRASEQKPRPITPPKNAVKFLSTKVAGVSHIRDYSEVIAGIEPGVELTLQREPSNEHDESAVLVLDAEGRKVGYLPKVDNAAASNLLDAGKELFALVDDVDYARKFAAIRITIYMRDN